MIGSLIDRLTGTQRYQVIHIMPGRELRTRKGSGRCIDNRSYTNVRAASKEDAKNEVPFGDEILRVIELS